MEVSIMIHVAVVLLFHWILSYFNQCHPLLYFLSFVYLYLVHDRYVLRLKRYLQFFERKQSSQKRVLTDSETVRWLNHAVEKIWPICMEQIVSRKILLPIIPWFLEKYKPWTAKEAVIQHLYMGRNPPLFTEMRVLHESAGDDHLVLELGMNFLTADDMSAILDIKLRKRLGFGMRAKLHLKGMHIEGKVLVGVKFLRKWPFLGRIRVCFVEPPYFQMTVKPLFTHGVDVTVLPGIAGWLDKLLSIAFEQTLVEPNMLVVDMEKFVSPEQESWFHVDEREAIAFVKIEVIEGSDMKPSDMNGLADPYVKAHIGSYRFRTQIHKKTLVPKWLEEFKVPVSTWESPNLLVIEVFDKDHFVDDSLGDCTININDLRGGQRHDMWLPLENIKMGRLHLAITVLEDKPDSVQADDKTCDGETPNEVDKWNSSSDENAHKGSVCSEKSTKVSDKFQPINIEGQQETGIWVHQPGSEVAQIWEPRKGKSRRLDTKILSVRNVSFNSASSLASEVLNNDSSSNDGSHDGKHAINSVRRGMRRISAVFNKGSKKEDPFNFEGNPAADVRSPYANIRAENAKDIGVKLVVEETLPGQSLVKPKEGSSSADVQSPCANIRAENAKDIGVKLVVEETLPGQSLVKPKEGSSSAEGSSPDSHNSKGHMKDMAKSIFKQAEKGARSLKHVLSRKDSKIRSADPSIATEREIYTDSDSADESSSSSLLSPGVEKTTSVSNPIGSCVGETQNVNNQGLEKVDIK